MEQKPASIRRRSDRYLTEPPPAAGAAPAQPPQPAPKSSPAVQPAFDYSRVEPEEVSAVSKMAAGMNVRPAAPSEDRPPLRRASSPVRPADSGNRRSSAELEGDRVIRSGHGRQMLQSPAPAAASQTQGAKRKKKKNPDVPLWLRISLITCFCLVMAAAAASLIMTGWLNQQREARALAEQRIVNAHPLQYRELIEQYAGEYNLQPAFVAAIILNESSYNSHAESGVGARGLMQLMPDTAEWIAHKLGMDAIWDVDLLWQPQINIRFGCWYFRYLNNLFEGDPVTVTSAYHTGQGQVSGWLLNENYSADGRTLSLDTMPDGPTKTYAGRVIRDYGIYDRLYFHAFNPEEAEDAADE